MGDEPEPGAPSSAFPVAVRRSAGEGGIGRLSGEAVRPDQAGRESTCTPRSFGVEASN